MHSRRACSLHKLQHIVRNRRLNADPLCLDTDEERRKIFIDAAVAELSWRTLLSASAYLIDGSVIESNSERRSDDAT